MVTNAYDSNGLTSKFVSLVVAIVVFACVLVPIVSSMIEGGGGGSGEQTITNTGVGYALADKDDAEHTIVLGKDGNDKMTVTVDGTPITIRTFPETDLDIMDRFTLGISADDNYLITAYGNGAVVGFGYGPDAEDEFGSWENGVTLTVQNGVISAGNTTHNIDLYLSANPDYVWTNDHPKAPLDDETVYLGYWEAIPDAEPNEFVASAYIKFGNGAEVLFKGDISDIENGLDSYTNDDYFYVYGGWTIEVSSDNGYYEVTTLKANYGSDEEPLYWYPGVIVPASFTVAGSGSGSDSDGGVDGMTATILGLIPVFVALGIIIAIVGMFYKPEDF